MKNAVVTGLSQQERVAEELRGKVQHGQTAEVVITGVQVLYVGKRIEVRFCHISNVQVSNVTGKGDKKDLPDAVRMKPLPIAPGTHTLKGTVHLNGAVNLTVKEVNGKPLHV